MIDQMFDYLNTRNCLGLILSMTSILEMGKELLIGETPKMKFFLTISFSKISSFNLKKHLKRVHVNQYTKIENHINMIKTITDNGINFVKAFRMFEDII
ncbi:unnamed protein product [Gordionus sp. m RMFG-2023]